MGLVIGGGVFARQAADESGAIFGTTVVIPGGLRGAVYFIPENTMVLPDFEDDRVQRVGEIWTNELNIPPRHWRDGFPGLTQRFEWFAIDYNGRFWIANPGRYTFALLSDDGSRLFVDDTPVIDNDCQHPPDVRLAAVQLEGGVHKIRVAYFQGPRDCLALILAVAGPDHQWRDFDVSRIQAALQSRRMAVPPLAHWYRPDYARRSFTHGEWLDEAASPRQFQRQDQMESRPRLRGSGGPRLRQLRRNC